MDAGSYSTHGHDGEIRKLPTYGVINCRPAHVFKFGRWLVHARWVGMAS
jgi:hypothetical protein